MPTFVGRHGHVENIIYLFTELVIVDDGCHHQDQRAKQDENQDGYDGQNQVLILVAWNTAIIEPYLEVYSTTST